MLLIASANVANLLLARAVTRRGQTAVRLALGANARQIVMQALTESVLLAIGGGTGRTAGGRGRRAPAADACLPQRALPAHQPHAFAHGPGVRLRIGARDGSRSSARFRRGLPRAPILRKRLHGAGRSTSDHSSFTRQGLLIVQATLSVVLVAGAMLLARSLNKLEHQDFGYQVHGRVVVELHNPPPTYTQPQLAALYRELETRLNRLPGVQGSGLAIYNPLTNNWGELIYVAGHPAPKMDEESGASWDRVSANYLQNFGIPVLRGAGFTAADNETSEPVAVVNQAFVKRFFKSGEDPLDQHFGLDMPENAEHLPHRGRGAGREVCGLWACTKPARPMFYVPLAQYVNYKQDLLKSIELRSHFIGGIMLVTNTPPGALEPLLTQDIGGT